MVQLCKVIVRWSFLSVVFFSLSLLSACAHSKQTSAESTQACQSNALLQRYHCSLKQVEMAANSNDADAEYALGYMYYYGIDAAENMDAAKLWMRRAAAQGQPQAIQALQILQISSIEPQTAAPKPVKKGPAPTTKPLATKATAPHKAVNATTAATATTTASAPTNLQTSYSIQLAASVDLPRLKEFVLMHHLKGKAGYYRACIKGTAWYILIYGHYPNRTAALQALRELPASLKGQAPWIKSYRTIQAQVADGNKC